MTPGIHQACGTSASAATRTQPTTPRHSQEPRCDKSNRQNDAEEDLKEVEGTASSGPFTETKASTEKEPAAEQEDGEDELTQNY